MCVCVLGKIYLYFIFGIYLAQETQTDWNASQPGSGASGITPEAKAAAEAKAESEAKRRRTETYEKAQAAQNERLREQAKAKAAAEAKMAGPKNVSPPPKAVPQKGMPVKAGPVPTKPMPKPAIPPKTVGWFLNNTTVVLQELPPAMADVPMPKAKALPPPPTRDESGAKAYAAAINRQTSGWHLQPKPKSL